MCTTAILNAVLAVTAFNEKRGIFLQVVVPIAETNKMALMPFLPFCINATNDFNAMNDYTARAKINKVQYVELLV